MVVVHLSQRNQRAGLLAPPSSRDANCLKRPVFVSVSTAEGAAGPSGNHVDAQPNRLRQDQCRALPVWIDEAGVDRRR